MPTKSNGKSGLWIALAVALSLVAVLGAFRFTSMYRSMSVTAAQAPELNAAAPGSIVKIVLEIGNAAPSDFRGKVLSKKTEEVYVRTNAQSSVHWNAQTKMVMGKPSDVHSGAIVHVTGKVRQDRSIDADQIVILTGYVKIE